VRLGPMDVKERSLRFLQCYEKEVLDAQSVVSLLGDKDRVSVITKAAGLQLRDFCEGGISTSA